MDSDFFGPKFSKFISRLIPESTEGTHLGYPEGQVLLETHLRHGKLSCDVVKRENEWQPPDDIVQALERAHASRVVDIITPWWRMWNRCTVL